MLQLVVDHRMKNWVKNRNSFLPSFEEKFQYFLKNHQNKLKTPVILFDQGKPVCIYIPLLLCGLRL